MTEDRGSRAQFKTSYLSMNRCAALYGTPAFLLIAVTACPAAAHSNPIPTAETGEGDGIVVTAKTEGDDSYTTKSAAAATRLPLTFRETPQSVTVVTRQRMDDQNLRSVQDVLEASTGIASRTLDSERVSFYARGFSVDSFSYDNIPTTFVAGASFLDTALYDRIEIVRGATGLMTGAGNPSASINLVRKRPTTSLAAKAEISGGSWNDFREMADLSGPLSADGHLRARVVGTYEDRDSFLARYHQKKKVAYGIVEADLSPRTTLSVGYDYQGITPRGTTWGGVPLYDANGARTAFSRSTSLAADWSRWDNEFQTAFATLEQHFGHGWTARAAFNHQIVSSNADLISALGYPDSVTGAGLIPVALQSQDHIRQDSLDLMVTGPFQLFGRRQELVVGAMGSRRREQAYSTGFIYPATPIADINSYDGSYPRPDFEAAPHSLTDTRVSQGGVYAVVRLTPVAPLHIIGGGRFSWYELDQIGTAAPYKTNGIFTPYAGAILDLDRHHSAYASYTEIFAPQTYRDRNNRVLTPMTGKTYEIGVKGEYFDGRLNAALSLFDTRQNNVAQIDTGQLLPDGTQAYYGASGTRSQGVDVDVQGQPLPGWSLSAGVSVFHATDATGARLSSQLPRGTAKLFTTYRLPGAFKRLTIGGGMTWQSRFYQAAVAPSGSVIAQQNAYALASLMARYSLTPKLSLSVNVDNLFDKTYYSMMGFYNQGLYGSPRKVMVTLRFGV